MARAEHIEEEEDYRIPARLHQTPNREHCWDEGFFFFFNPQKFLHPKKGQLDRTQTNIEIFFFILLCPQQEEEEEKKRSREFFGVS
jgi:hypothetical protein